MSSNEWEKPQKVTELSCRIKPDHLEVLVFKEPRFRLIERKEGLETWEISTEKPEILKVNSIETYGVHSVGIDRMGSITFLPSEEQNMKCHIIPLKNNKQLWCMVEE